MEKKWTFPILRRHRMSVFAVHLMLMLVMLGVATSSLLLANRLSSRTLMEQYCEELELSVEQGCERMSSALFRTYAIPPAIQNSRYYAELTGERVPSPTKTYAWMLPQFSTVLGDQVYSSGDSIERLVYIPYMDSICTNSRCFVKAEDCFESYLFFENTDAGTMMDLLKERNGYTLLPMQKLYMMPSTEGMDCLAFILRPVGAELSVMSIYQKETILEHLGFDTLPAGSCYRITDADGTVLMEDCYTEEGNPDQYYELSAGIDPFGLQLDLRVPMDYFNDRLGPAYRTGTILAAGTAIVGFLMCVLFADISTRKIRKLARVHHAPKRPFGGVMKGDEVDYLAHVINESQSKTESLREMMVTEALVRAFSGVLLLKNDEELLRPCYEAMEGDYRIALLDLPPEVNFALKTKILPENLGVPFFCESISDRNAGILFSAGDEGVAQLQNVLQLLNSAMEQNGERIVCGISEPASTPDRLYIAVRQARIAMQEDKGICVYTRANMQRADEGMLWMQYQRLYQYVLERNESDARRAIREFVQFSGTGREAFYNVVFVLRSAAEEMGLEIYELDEVLYESHMPVWENVKKLESLLLLLLAEAREQDVSVESDPRQQVLQYIKKNSSDSELCLASIASHFGMSEKKVYTLVQEATNMKFREYMLSLRMRKAAYLLTGTQKSVDEIARECGYPAESTFFRVFKKYYDCTPSRYRRSGAEDETQE